MSECLLITNGSSILENMISSVPVVNNVKEPLPDSSAGNDSECAAKTVPPTTIAEQNGDDGSIAADNLDNGATKIHRKEAVNGGHITDPIPTANAIFGSDSLPEVTAKVAPRRVKKKVKRVAKIYEKSVRNVPRRTINGTHPKHAPVIRHKGVVEKPKSTMLNGLNQLNSSRPIDHKETKNESSLKKECVASVTELCNTLPYAAPPVAAKSKQGDQKITQLEICEQQCENEQKLEEEVCSTTKDPVAQPIKKANPSKKSGLSHFQIMRKVLNKKALYDALLVDRLFECPICHVRKQKAQYLLLHLKGHNDLTLVFERFQAFGEPIEEIEKGCPESPNLIVSQNAILPKTENPSVGKVLRKKKSKAIITKFGIPILPLLKPKLTKKIINRTDSAVQSKPVEIEVSLPAAVVSEMPAVEPIADPEPKPILSGQKRKRKIPIKRISKTETYEEPPDDVIVDAKKSRLGISHTRALDPELYEDLKQVMRQKVTEFNPHKCKFCGKMFSKGQGIYAHYFKHSRAMASPATKTESTPDVGPPQDLRNIDAAFDALLAVNDNKRTNNKDTERNSDNDFLTLQELETNVNRLLRSLVKDTNVLRNLGWPERRVSDLVIDILERCSLQPAYCGASRLSQLQCLRQNMGKLFRFCIKEESMARYGWDIKLVDIVVREMMATEECLNRSRLST